MVANVKTITIKVNVVDVNVVAKKEDHKRVGVGCFSGIMYTKGVTMTI